MKCRLFSVVLSLLLSAPAFSQAPTTVVVQGIIRDSTDRDPIPRATLRFIGADTTRKRGAISDGNGHYHIELPEDEYRLNVTSAGYHPFTRALDLDDGDDSLTLNVLLIPAVRSTVDVIVSATRSERSIDNTPVRVELVGAEDIEEKIMEKPSSVIELLNESPGTRIQSASPTSGAANIRIQGLQGRYTQVLVDGIPSYSGLASSFGLTQLQPLNLKRVEIVKGATSASYGPDAIAGIINFITKDPAEPPQLDAVINASQTKGFDGSAFYSQQFDEVGGTLLASFNKQDMVDLDRDGLTDIPSSTRFSVTPKLSYEIVDNVTGTTTVTYMQEKRLGGSMLATESSSRDSLPWSESDKSTRIDFATIANIKLPDSSSVILRAAAMHLERNSFFGGNPFAGTQDFRLADAQYEFPVGFGFMQIGVATQQDEFGDKTSGVPDRSYSYNDAASWLQTDVQLRDNLEFLASLRVDAHTLGTFLTPRASLLYRPAGSLTFRAGAGTGFKAPTPFLEEVESREYHNLEPLSNVKCELSQNGSVDVEFHAPIDNFALKADLAGFITNLDHALLLDDDSLTKNILFVRNATGKTGSRGAELTTTLSLDELSLSLSYVYLDTRQNDERHSTPLELNPKHWLGTSLTFEEEDDGWKAGIEAYYIGEQQVDFDPYRKTSPSYWLSGLLLEKAWGIVHLFLNCENVLDVRQSRYEPLYIPTPSGGYWPLPSWAPAEGCVINGGVHIAMH